MLSHLNEAKANDDINDPRKSWDGEGIVHN